MEKKVKKSSLSIKIPQPKENPGPGKKQNPSKHKSNEI